MLGELDLLASFSLFFLSFLLNFGSSSPDSRGEVGSIPLSEAWKLSTSSGEGDRFAPSTSSDFWR